MDKQRRPCRTKGTAQRTSVRTGRHIPITQKHMYDQFLGNEVRNKNRVYTVQNGSAFSPDAVPIQFGRHFLYL